MMVVDNARWQEFNQLLSQTGLPAAVPDSSTTAMADQMDEVLSDQEGMFDAHPITRSIAGEMIGELKQTEVEYDARWCPSFDEANPETMSRYYLLAYGSNTLIPLENLDQWIPVTDVLFPDPKCDVHLLDHCYRLREQREFAPAETVSMKRGEIVCVFNICILCMEALRWIKFGSAEYSGPMPWMDDGNRNYDPWSI